MVIRQKTRAYAQRLSDEALGTREQEQEEDKVKKELLVSLRDIHTLHFRDFHFFLLHINLDRMICLKINFEYFLNEDYSKERI